MKMLTSLLRVLKPIESANLKATLTRRTLLAASLGLGTAAACGSKKSERRPAPQAPKPIPSTPDAKVAAPKVPKPEVVCDEQRPHLGIVRVEKDGTRVKKAKPVKLTQGGKAKTITITTKASDFKMARTSDVRLIFVNADREPFDITQEGNLTIKEGARLSKTETIVKITVKISADEAIPAGKYDVIILFKTTVKGKSVEIPIGVKLEAIEVREPYRGRGEPPKKGPCDGKTGIFKSACLKRFRKKGSTQKTPRPRARKSSNPCKGKTGVFLSACKKRFGK